MIDRKALRKTLPQTLSGEQVRKVLHVSKRKCAWMLQNGMIPCTVRGKKTRCYTVERSALIRFMADYDARPEKYPIPQIFSSKPSRTHRLQTPPPDYRQYLEEKLANLPDALTRNDLHSTLGYESSTVNHWLQSGLLRSVSAHSEALIVKEWLIDFLCGYGYRITRKAENHQKLMPPN